MKSAFSLPNVKKDSPGTAVCEHPSLGAFGRWSEGSKSLVRHLVAIVGVLLMVGAAEFWQEKEIVFPELVALTVGLWIIDKRVWRASGWQVIVLMFFGAVAGVCLVRYSPLPYLLNLCVAFAFAGACLLIFRATLIPLISACALPVLLQTHAWIYPLAVLTLCVILVLMQKLMVRLGLRLPVEYVPANKADWSAVRTWLRLLCFVFLAAALAVVTGCLYLLIPPLLVTFAEMATSAAGFRNRPVQVFVTLVLAVLLGTASQIVGNHWLHLPQVVTAAFVVVCLFLFFRITRRYFAPAGAMAFIPMIVPQGNLVWLPLQAAIGAALFIAVSLVVFQKCHRWSRAQLAFCLTPEFLRKQRISRKRK